MNTYKFKWKVEDGLHHVTYGEETIQTKRKIHEDELIEAISESAGVGSGTLDTDWIIGGRLSILFHINTCDAGCQDWHTYKMIKKETVGDFEK